MSNTEELNEYKSSYTIIFSLNYLMQGLVISIFGILIPVFLIGYMGALKASDLAFLATFISAPTLLKIFYGVLTDKIGIKKMGRRKPWILASGIISGFLCLVFPFLITPTNILMMAAIFGFVIFVSIYMIDTATDAFLLDICPKKRLGRTQGLCFSTRAIGTITGGPIFLYLVVIIELLTIQLVFVIMGILLIIVAALILIVKAIEAPLEVKLGIHLKSMFNTSRDWKLYLYSIFNSLLNQVVFIFLSIYILIQMNLIEFKPGGSLSLGGTETNLYIYQANIGLITSAGIMLGSILGGRISDLLSRKIGVYITFLISTITILLILIDVNLIGLGILLFFAGLIGFAMGLRLSTYTAVAGQMSKKHPEMIGTFFAICMMFANIGVVLGLLLTGIIFSLTASFVAVFIFMAVIQNIGLLFFYLLNPKDYEPDLDQD
ncbi:MAG: MFS transporter [Promethearchaeota archaeon]|nr:MAG: MFS transporter [Candidatus Lokiarchaeota archaeon]